MVIYRSEYPYRNLGRPIEISAFNRWMMEDEDMNPGITRCLHECAGSCWPEVPKKLGKAIFQWNWGIKDESEAFIDLICSRRLTDAELGIMFDVTTGQIEDGYNENPWEYEGSSISLETYPKFSYGKVLEVSERSELKEYVPTWPYDLLSAYDAMFPAKS